MTDEIYSSVTVNDNNLSNSSIWNSSISSLGLIFISSIEEFESFKLEELIDDNCIYVEGKEIDITKDINSILSFKAKEIINSIKQSFPEQSKYSRWLFIGGGSLLLRDYLSEYKVLDDAQMINVKTYDIIGRTKNA